MGGRISEMKSKPISRRSATARNARFLIRTLLLGFFVLDREARAQYVLAPAPETPDQTPVAVQQPREMDVFATPPPSESQPFRWGAFTLRPHPYYQFLYAEGLQSGPSNAVHTVIQNIAPGALLVMGQHWTIDYTPVFSIYSNGQFSDTFGQTVKLMGGTVYNDWRLGLTQSYVETDTPSVVTASQTRQQTFSTAASGAYTINSKTSLDLGLNQIFVKADQFSSYNEWATLDWLNYEISSRLNAAAGLGAGYDNVKTGSDMAFERLQGRVNWRASDRISFRLNGGFEFRQFINGTNSANQSVVNPVFGLTVQYQPFELTQISVTGERTVSASFLQDQFTENTGVSARLNQRLLRKYFCELYGGYQYIKYVSTIDTSVSERNDNYYFLNIQLGRTFLRRGSFSINYQLSHDDSSLPGYSFTSHQIGFQIGYSY